MAEPLAAQAALVSDLLKSLAHPQRLMIACLIADGPLAVSEIEARLGIHQPALSAHLAALREAGVIAGSRSAKSVIYRLSDVQAGALLAALSTIFCATPPVAPSPARTAVGHGASVGLAGAAQFARIGQGGAS